MTTMRRARIQRLLRKHFGDGIRIQMLHKAGAHGCAVYLNDRILATSWDSPIDQAIYNAGLEAFKQRKGGEKAPVGGARDVG